MTALSLLGLPNDDNSSYLKGSALAPPLIRRELHCDAYSIRSESGIDFGAPGRLLDHGDLRFDDGVDPWRTIERGVERALAAGGPLLCLGGDHAVTHPILRAVRRVSIQPAACHSASRDGAAAQSARACARDSGSPEAARSASAWG